MKYEYYYTEEDYTKITRQKEQKGHTRPTLCKFKGRVFAEEVIQGEEPLGRFEDSFLLGTGQEK